MAHLFIFKGFSNLGAFGEESLSVPAEQRAAVLARRSTGSKRTRMSVQ